MLVGFTAIQWLPTWYWLQNSTRSTVSAKVEQYNLFDKELLESDFPVLLRELVDHRNSDRSTMARPSTYGFSVAPWHFLTLIWGSSGGHYLPENSRWLQAVTAEPRMWCPSLTIGLVPALLAISGWFHRPTRNSQKFVLIIIFLAATAMCGNFSPTWLLRQWLTWFGDASWSSLLPSDETGGMYWLLSQCIPGYDSFRYPAKWTVWFACSLALSSAHALEHQHAIDRIFRRLCIGSVVLMSLSAIALLLLKLNFDFFPLQSYLGQWLKHALSDPWLGKPSLPAVVMHWQMGIFLGLTVAVITVLAMCFRVEKRSAFANNLRIATLMVITMAELYFSASSWMVFTVPPQPFSMAPSSEQSYLKSMERVWSNTSGADVLGDSAIAVTNPDGLETVQLRDYQNEFQLGKLHLLCPQRRNLSATFSLSPRSLVLVRQRLAQSDDLRSVNPPLDQALSWLGVNRRLVRDGGLRWQNVPDARPFLFFSASNSRTSQHCMADIENWQPDKIRVRVSAAQSVLMTIQLFQDGGWTAILTPLIPGIESQSKSVTTSIPASTHLGLFQTLEIPAGQWQLTLIYQSPGLQLGACITLSTIILVGLCTVAYFPPNRSRSATVLHVQSGFRVVQKNLHWRGP